MNKRLSRLLSVLIIIGLCISSMYIPIKAAGSSPQLNKEDAVLEVGQTIKLQLLNSKGTVKWKSGDTDIAKVSSKGVVTAKDSGYVTIIATDKGTNKEYICMLTIYEKTVTIEYGNSYKIKAKKGVQVEDYEINDEFEYHSFSITLGWTATIKPSKKPKYQTMRSEIWLDFTDGSSKLYSFIIVDSSSDVVDTTTPIPTQKPVVTSSPTPTPKPTATPTPTPVPTATVKLTNFEDTYHFSSSLVGGGKFYSDVTISNITISDKSSSNDSRWTFEIDFQASSKATYDNITPIGKIRYWFDYTIRDKDGFIISTSSFYLPEMSIGDKIKDSFSVSMDKKYGNYFTISVSVSKY